MLVKPRFGRRRCRGIWPPSKPILREYPERDFCPFSPRPAVLPKPEPGPRPTRFFLWVEPFAGFRLLRLIAIFYSVISPIGPIGPILLRFLADAALLPP